MSECGRIKQGNTGPLWRVGVKERDADGNLTGNYVDLTNYTCQVACLTASPPIDRPETNMSSDDQRFLVQLTPAETATMEASKTHTVAVEIENTNLTPEFNIEVHLDLQVDPSII